MKSIINPSISVDCVVFGFDDTELKVLLVDVIKDNLGDNSSKHNIERKLPGSLIREQEDLSSAAQRTLSEMTGLNDIFLRQLYVFSDPLRVSKPEDLNWISKTYGVEVHRIVTVAFYALVKIDKSVLQHTIEGMARWHSALSIKHLAFDHKAFL
ncbi:MAG: hypothetical protein Q8908_16770 [Bacteroidota bacterium]|nr:hypothetical protein [Bacteroidota bacterium]